MRLSTASLTLTDDDATVSKPEGSRSALFCAIAALLGGVVYLNALQNPFVYDDIRTVVDNGSIARLWDLRSIVGHEATRPVTNLSFAVDRAVWGTAPFGFHFTSVLLHMLNVVLLYQVGWLCASDLSSPDRGARGHVRPGTMAFVAAALLAVHPMMTEAVGYISGRAEVLSGTFFLCAFLCARRVMRGGRGAWWAPLVGFWGLALLTKETAVMFPLVVLSYDRLVLQGSAEERRRRLWRLHAPLCLVAGAGALARVVVFVQWERGAGGAIHWHALLDQAVVTWRYVALLVVPRGQAVFHEVQPAPIVVGLAAAAAILVAVTALWRGRALAAVESFGVFWFLLVLLPAAALTMIGEVDAMAEHRVYLASIGLFLTAGALGSRVMVFLWPAGPSLRLLWRVMCTVALLSLGARTLLRNAYWADPVTLWQEAADKAPTQWLPRAVLGESLHAQGRHEEAIVAHRAALQRKPDDALGYVKLAICLAELGRVDEATAAMEEFRRVDPLSPVTSTGLGAVAAIAGRIAEARQHFQDTLDRDPSNVMARQWLAVLDEHVDGDAANALRRCYEIQQLTPGKLSTLDCIERNRPR